MVFQTLDLPSTEVSAVIISPVTSSRNMHVLPYCAVIIVLVLFSSKKTLDYNNVLVYKHLHHALPYILSF